MQLKRISETLLELQVAEVMQLQSSEMVVKMYHYFKQASVSDALGIIDVVPTFTTLGLHIDVHSPLFDNAQIVMEHGEAAQTFRYESERVRHTIEVEYRGEDLAFVAKATGLSEEQVITYHTQPVYHVAMQGFRAYFPYLLGLHSALQLPRRVSPRKRIDQGAVAIAGNQAGIYSEASPGGWHIVGYTDFDAFDTIHAGDEICFRVKDNDVN